MSRLSVQVISLIPLACLFSISSLLLAQKASAQSIEYDSGRLKIELSDDVQAAIDSGVSLTFESQFAHTKKILFIDRQTKLEQHDFVISKHILSNRYLVREDNRVEPRIFSSTRESMTYIGDTAIARFAKYHLGQSHSESVHKMRLRLSKTKLPGPMRLTAFIASDWDLDSGWTAWQSDQ